MPARGNRFCGMGRGIKGEGVLSPSKGACRAVVQAWNRQAKGLSKRMSSSLWYKMLDIRYLNAPFKLSPNTLNVPFPLASNPSLFDDFAVRLGLAERSCL